MKHSPREIADLFDKPGHLIRRAHQISVAAFEQAAAPFKITGPQHVIMTALYKYPGVDQITLAGMVALDKVTTGDIVMRLEQRGLVRRTRSSQNHRSRAVSLTAAGRKMLLEMQSIVESSKEEILHNLSERERVALMRLLRRLIGADKPMALAGTADRPEKPRRAAQRGTSLE